MPTEIYMVRHAESPFSFGEERTRGLSEHGMADAQRVTDLFREIALSAVVSSPYARAVQTVQGIAESKGLAITVLEQLKERAIKSLDVKAPWETIEPAIEQSFSDIDYCLPGGETTRAAQKRAIPVIEELLKRYDGEAVAVGTHGNIMTIIMNYYNQAYGYEFWKSSSKPDAYRLAFEQGRLEGVDRLWSG